MQSIAQHKTKEFKKLISIPIQNIEKQLAEEFEEIRKEYLSQKIKQCYGKEFMTKQFEQQTMDNFIVNKENQNIKEIAQRFLQNLKNSKQKGIIFTGPTGTGKTHISTAISNELIKQNVPVIFGTLEDLLSKYQNNANNELTMLYAKVDLLVIDDLGKEFIDDWGLAKLFVIVNERMKNELPIIITTNCSIDELKEKLTIPDNVGQTADAIISRLCYMCEKVECRGKIIKRNNENNVAIY